MEWFETWFDTPYYHLLYQNRDYKEAEDFIKKLTEHLRLPKNAYVIDLACGKGRHSVYLNKLGYKVLGLDLSKKSIEYDKQFENETLKFEVHDMRDKIKGEKADAVFNLFTSFGYFDNSIDDKKMFLSVAEVLKPKAYFVLDFLNEHFVKNNLEKNSEIIRENVVFKIRKKIENQYVIKNIDFEDQGKTHQFYEKVKLYTPEEINLYAEEVGLKRIKIWGDYQLNPYQKETSPKCITLFEKI